MQGRTTLHFLKNNYNLGLGLYTLYVRWLSLEFSSQYTINAKYQHQSNTIWLLNVLK